MTDYNVKNLNSIYFYNLKVKLHVKHLFGDQEIAVKVFFVLSGKHENRGEERQPVARARNENQPPGVRRRRRNRMALREEEDSGKRTRTEKR